MMKRWLLGVGFALMVCQVMAQQALVEGCKALADAEKRAACFEALLQQRPAPQAPHVLEAMRREGQAVMSATNVGISLVQLQQALQRLATEIDLAKGKAESDGDRAEVEAYVSALDAYRDSATFWSAWISFYSQRGNSSSYAGGLPLRLANVEWLASKYGFGTVNADLLGIFRGLPKSTVQQLWGIGRERIEGANKPAAKAGA